MLLATHNGEEFLPEQLASIRSQAAETVDVLASDDRSADRTREVLGEAAGGWERGRFDILDGPSAGFAENFRSLIRRAPDDGTYYAFCDQDDIWLPDKFERARRAIGAIAETTPVLYCSRTRIVHSDGRQSGLSPLMRRPPGFRNALVQSIAGGNTMVLNRAAFLLVRDASGKAPFVSHDWWSYLVVSGAGGTVIYDPEPTVLYRQHGGNLVGANNSVAARLRRIRGLFASRFRRWDDVNLAALKANRELLAPANAMIVDRFAAARDARNPLRLVTGIWQLGLFRQSRLGNLSLLFGAILGKI